jgi:hypothetical protein
MISRLDAQWGSEDETLNRGAWDLHGNIAGETVGGVDCSLAVGALE